MKSNARIVIGILALLVILGVILLIYTKLKEDVRVVEPLEPTPIATEEPTPAYPLIRTIGSSVEGRPIEAYTFGSGETHLLFVGGIHGGYEWNSVLLAYEFIDHLGDGTTVPPELTLTVIPSLNPDGVFKVIGKEGRFALADVPVGADTTVGRFNANGIDLNRNFACKWQPESSWRGKTVSAGTEAFSEPEAKALRDLVAEIAPAAVVFWHSKANAVYASECTEGILPGTRTLMDTYASAASYPAIDTFDAYPVTGDAEGWLASIGIPAITVELSSHESLEFERNLLGFTALLEHYKTAK
jgi:hypothetical protein